jgi:hypothetical protein
VLKLRTEPQCLLPVLYIRENSTPTWQN